MKIYHTPRKKDFIRLMEKLDQERLETLADFIWDEYHNMTVVFVTSSETSYESLSYARSSYPGHYIETFKPKSSRQVFTKSNVEELFNSHEKGDKTLDELKEAILDLGAIDEEELYEVVIAKSISDGDRLMLMRSVDGYSPEWEKGNLEGFFKYLTGAEIVEYDEDYLAFAKPVNN